MVCAFFKPFRKMLMVVASLLNLHLLASYLNLWTYVANDSLSVCWMSINQLIEVWISMFDIFRQRDSLISSQLFCAVNALEIKVLTNPLDFTCANLSYFCQLILRLFLYLLTSPQAVKSLAHLVWVYLVIKNSPEMFSFVQCIRFQCIYLTHFQ